MRTHSFIIYIEAKNAKNVDLRFDTLNEMEKKSKDNWINERWIGLEKNVKICHTETKDM